MNNQQSFNDEQSPRVVISGGIFSDIEYERFAEITPQDIENAAEDWERTAPDKYKNLLNAE